MSACSAERAESNGGAASETSSSSASSATSGIPGTAMAATSSARSTSLAIITRWRGSRSARVDSTGPPSNQGR